MNTIKGNLKYQSQFNEWWVHWGEKSQMIDKSIDTSNFVDGDRIEFRLSISEIDERYRAFPI
jgi:hypothetical protein